jgi:hypothetical protein
MFQMFPMYISDPLMAVLVKEENGHLRSYLTERRNQLYEDANPQETLLGMAMGVAKGMAYLAELKVQVRQLCTVYH